MLTPLPTPQGFGGWFVACLIILWGVIITFGPPVFLYLFWRGFVDIHRIANALDPRVPQTTDPKYIRMPRQRLEDARKGDSIVPSAFGR